MKLLISILYLLSSVFLFAQTDNSNFIFHKAEQGENLYAISKKYCVGLNQLTESNPEIKDYIISIGQIIKIPTEQEKDCFDTIIPAFRFPSNAILHEVKKGETLYGIAKMYACPDESGNSLTVKKVREWNELVSDTLKLSQQLIVGWKKKTEENKQFTIENKLQEKNIPIIVRGDSILLKEYVQQKDSTKTEKQEMTIATWLPKTSDDDNGFYALHKYIPGGTILKIKNLMNNEEVFVKVIGKLPALGENNNLQLKISAPAASQLGVLDSRFLVDIYYLVPTTELAEKK